MCACGAAAPAVLRTGGVALVPVDYAFRTAPPMADEALHQSFVRVRNFEFLKWRKGPAQLLSPGRRRDPVAQIADDARVDVVRVRSSRRRSPRMIRTVATTGLCA
jgi:hypothetical protein